MVALLLTGVYLILSDPPQALAVPSCSSLTVYYTDRTLTSIAGERDVECEYPFITFTGYQTNNEHFWATGECTDFGSCNNGEFICQDGVVTYGTGDYAPTVGMSCTSGG